MLKKVQEVQDRKEIWGVEKTVWSKCV